MPVDPARSALDYAIFEHPQNGHREHVSRLGHLWALLFGLFYFVLKGAWTHVIVQALIIGLAALLGALGWFVMLFVWAGYAIAAPSIVAKTYRRRGWREVSEGPAI